MKRGSTAKPFFLYWAPDSTHSPSYASPKFRGSSARSSPYGDAVHELDAAVGEILDLLRKMGIANNTLVVFTSDNGAALISKSDGGSNGPFLCGKQTTFEGGFRAPTIAWWPSVIPSGTVSRQASTQMDLFTTFANVSGSGLPSDLVLDGQDITNVLLDPKIEYDKPVFFYRGDILMAVRFGSYKMHLWTWATPPQYKNVRFVTLLFRSHVSLSGRILSGSIRGQCHHWPPGGSHEPTSPVSRGKRSRREISDQTRIQRVQGGYRKVVQSLCRPQEDIGQGNSATQLVWRCCHELGSTRLREVERLLGSTPI